MSDINNYIIRYIRYMDRYRSKKNIKLHKIIVIYILIFPANFNE